MTTPLKLVESCNILGLEKNFQGILKLTKNPPKKILTFFFAFTNLLINLCYFLKIYNSTMLFYFATTNKMMWG
jgi:hypothetical protein